MRNRMKRGWSKWRCFKDAESDWEDVPESPGVYQIRAVDRESGKPVSISRLIGEDKKGILGIGESNNLRKRSKQFWASVMKEGNNENPDNMKRKSRAWLYLKFKYDKRFGKDCLQFCFKECKNKKEAKASESDLLCYYRTVFLDGPPLNRTL